MQDGAATNNFFAPVQVLRKNWLSELMWSTKPINTYESTYFRVFTYLLFLSNGPEGAWASQLTNLCVSQAAQLDRTIMF